MNNRHRRKRNKQRRYKPKRRKEYGTGIKRKMERGISKEKHFNYLKKINKNKILPTLPDRLVNIVRKSSRDRPSGRLLNYLGSFSNSLVPSNYTGRKRAKSNIYKNLANGKNTKNKMSIQNENNPNRDPQSSNSYLGLLDSLTQSLLLQPHLHLKQDNQRHVLASKNNQGKRQNNIENNANLPNRILNLVRSSGALELSKMILNQVTKILVTALNSTSKGTLFDINSGKYESSSMRSSMKQSDYKVSNDMDMKENCQCPVCPEELNLNEEPDWDKHPLQDQDLDQHPSQGQDRDQHPSQGQEWDKHPSKGQDWDNHPLQGQNRDKHPFEGLDEPPEILDISNVEKV